MEICWPVLCAILHDRCSLCMMLCCVSFFLVGHGDILYHLSFFLIGLVLLLCRVFSVGFSIVVDVVLMCVVQLGGAYRVGISRRCFGKVVQYEILLSCIQCMVCLVCRIWELLDNESISLLWGFDGVVYVSSL